MKWQRVTIVSRLFCLLLGLSGLPIAWMLFSNPELLRNQPMSTWLYLAIAGCGFLMFLLVGILGRFPDIPLQGKDDNE